MTSLLLEAQTFTRVCWLEIPSSPSIRNGISEEQLIGKLLNMHYAAIMHKMPFPRHSIKPLLTCPFLCLLPKTFPLVTEVRRYKNTGMLHTQVVHGLKFLSAYIWGYGPSSSAEILRRGAEELLSGVVSYQASQGTLLLTANLGSVKWIQGKQWQVPDNTSGNN